MGGEWREMTVLEFSPFTYGKGLPESRRNASGQIPVYGSNGIVGFHDVPLTDGPTVVIGRKGTVGGVHYSPVPCWPIDTTFYVTGAEASLVRYRYYVLKSLDLEHMNADSAVPGLNRNAAHARRVRVPVSETEQRAIAHILGTLDDKIDLNRRMSETLEQMARALFKSWFVDFDPVRAKIEGRWRKGQTLPGLPAHLYDLFPARLVPSELGEIPEGWEVQALADHFDAVKGVSYKGTGLTGSGMPLHNLNSVYEGGGYKYEGIKYYAGDYAERHVVRPGDVIVANTEQGHDRLLIGYAAIVPTFFGDRGIASHHIYRLRPKPPSPLTAAFLCYLLNSPKMHDIVSGYANGTTVNMLPIDGVQKPKIVCPPRPLVAAFDSLASKTQQRLEEMVFESRTLADMRDTLLPKVISGELRIADAENFIGRVA